MGRKRDLLAKAIPAFLLAFAVFFGVGFFAGLDERERKARDAVYGGLVYGTDEDGAAVLRLHCAADGATHDYLVASNRLVPGLAGLRAQWIGNPSDENLALRAAVLAFLGGPAGAVSYKSVIDAWNKARQQPRWPYLARLIGGIVGGISGYALGYWQGATWAIGCETDLGRRVLADEARWQLAEKLYFHIAVIELELGESARVFARGARNVNPMEDDPLFLCKTTFMAVSRELGRIDDPGAEDFRRLVSLIAAYRGARASAEYRRVAELQPTHIAVTKGGVDPDSPLGGHRGYSPEAFAAACAALDAAVRQRLS